nr:reverse transcriptase domain-containing protein [Tanacetum cinerariifolium]
METDKVSERYIAPCFMNGLETYDGEINLAFDENLISNEYAMKLCLDYKVKKGQKLAKKELIINLKGELYFVKFIINPEEDDVEPGVILGRSYIILAKGIIDFGNGVIIIYPELDSFEDNSEKKKIVQMIGINYLISILMMYQSLEKNFLRLRHLTQEEEAKEALAIRISQKFALLEEVRHVIEIMAYNDKVELDGKIVKEEEEAVERIKGEALKDKDDLGAFIFSIRLEGKIIKFRLGGRAHSLTLLEFACKLGLYQKYWLSISREENLSLSRSHASTIKYPVLRVIHKMITYGLCQRKTGDLDTTTLRELIDSNSRLIPEDPQPGVPRVGISRPSRASMQDLYDRMGRMEIRQESIERMEYRQSYHWDSYQGVFNTHLRHHNIIISSSKMMMSSVKTTQVGYVTVLSGSPRMDAITMNMDAQYKEFQSRSKQPNLDHNDDDKPMSPEEEARFIQTFRRMPNYGKFLKELVSNKHKLEQILFAFLSDQSSAMIQNKIPPKLLDSRSFLVPCNFSKAFSCNDLADLCASINLMPYSLYAKLSLETLKPTKMSVRLADRSFQHPIGIAKNMLVQVGRHFLHTADVVIRVKQKQLNLGVGTERMIFHFNSAMKHSYSNNDTCFSIDVIDEILEEDFNSLLDEWSEILYSIEGTIL